MNSAAKHTPHLPTYAAALAAYTNATAIRGRPDTLSWRPLSSGGARYKKAYGTLIPVLNIRTEGRSGEGLPNLVVRLHHTDILVYEPSGAIHVTSDGWNTITTAQHLEQLLLGSANVKRAQDRLWLQDQHLRWGLVGDRVPTVLNTGSDKDFTRLVDPVGPVEHRLNRKAMRKIRKQFAPLAQYIRGRAALDEQNRGAYLYGYPGIVPIPSFLDRIQEGDTSVDTLSMAYEALANGVRDVTAGVMAARLDKMLMAAFADEVMEEYPQDEPARDRYAAYVGDVYPV